MADHGLAITWGAFKPGRERKALDLWNEALGFNDKVVADGRIEGWDAILFEPSGTSPAGALRYYGSADQVGAMALSEDFLGLIERGQQLLFDFGFRRFVIGQAMADAVIRVAGVVDQL